MLRITDFSPGTPSTVAVTVCVPAGGEDGNVTWAVDCWPGVVCGTVAVALIVVPVTATLIMTLFSTFAPPFVKATVNVGGGLAGIVLRRPCCSVVPPTLTESSEWPWAPGAGLPAGEWLPGHGAFEASVVGVSH